MDPRRTQDSIPLSSGSLEPDNEDVVSSSAPDHDFDPATLFDPRTFDTSYFQHVARIQASTEDNGLIQVPRRIIERKAALCTPSDLGESHSGHEDTVREMVTELADGLAEYSPIRQISSPARRLIRTAAEFHDDGKCGPPDSVNPDPMPFVRLYNTPFKSGIEEMLLRTALDIAVNLRQLTPRDRAYIKEVVRRCGYDPDKIYYRTLINMHSPWTYVSMLESARLEGMDMSTIEPVAKAAGGHHLQRGIRINGYPLRELAETGRFIEPMDKLAAIARKNNPAANALSIRERIAIVYKPLAERQSPIQGPYSEILNVGIASGVIPQILERHPRQRP